MLTLVMVLGWARPVSAALASWYGEEHRGRLMANRHPFNPDRLTCASWFHPLGTWLEVGLIEGGRVTRWVQVEVTDRGPHRRFVRQGRMIDLSAAAFGRLADRDLGLVPVVIRKPSQKRDS
jgi:rare lipoprotein A